MCFSAPVSFTASAFVAAAGIMALRAARDKADRPLASVPLLFAAQQFIEGWLWVIVPAQGTTPLSGALTQIYAFFIGMVWPVLIPFSVLMIETRPLRKRLIGMVLFLGTGVAVYTLVILVRFGVSVRIANQCLVYENPMGGGLLVDLIYLVATCASFFVSSHRSVRLIGIANLIGFGVAYRFYHLNYPSVWCFFAALMSVMINLHFRQKRRLPTLGR